MFSRNVLKRTTTLTTLALATLSASVASASPATFAAPAAAPAMVRVVHGSPDAGPVTVSVNGKAAIKNFLYGTVTSYLSLTPGSYTLTVTTAGGAKVMLSATLKAGTFYSVVATGEIAPKADPKKPNIALTPYVDAPFSAMGEVNFHHAAPVVDSKVPFGYGLLANPVDEALGSATFGTETGPLMLPMKAQSQPLELYAVGVDAITLIPNQIDPKDVKNTLPSPAGANLSAFAIDGPAAAQTPSISGTDAVRLIGAFDAKGM